MLDIHATSSALAPREQQLTSRTFSSCKTCWLSAEASPTRRAKLAYPCMFFASAARP
jgi:hypothetical protein